MRPPWAPAEWSSYNPWDPAQSNKPDDLEWEFDLTDSRLTQDHFSAVLKPLFRHRKKMMVLEGLNMLSTAWDTEGGDGHAQGHVAALCGSAGRKYDGVKAVAVTPSIDQVISDFLRRTDPAHQSLDFRPSARRVRDEYFHEWLFKADSTGQVTRLPVEVNPETAYSRLFGTSTTGTDPRSAARRNLLSLIRDQYRAVGNQVGAADRVKLDKHRQMIEDLQSSLGVVRSCDRRTPPATVTIPNGLERRRDRRHLAEGPILLRRRRCHVVRVQHQPRGHALGRSPPPTSSTGWRRACRSTMPTSTRPTPSRCWGPTRATGARWWAQATARARCTVTWST